MFNRNQISIPPSLSPARKYSTCFSIKEETSPKNETEEINDNLEILYEFNKNLSVSNLKTITKMTKSHIQNTSIPSLNDQMTSSALLKHRQSLMLESNSIHLESIIAQQIDLNSYSIKNILKKIPSERTEKDIIRLQSQLSQLEFFRTLGLQKEQNLLEKVCHFLMLETYYKDQYIFNYGEIGSKFYIVLEGSVSVLIPEKDFRKFKEVKILKIGDSFGELALISKKTRSASIVCKEESCFAVLEKKYFYEILHDFESKKLQKSLDFLLNYKLFNGWNTAELTSLYLSMNEKKYKRGQPVYLQNSIANEIIFIKNGEFELRKEICVSDLKTKMKEPKIFKSFTIAYYRPESMVGEEDIILNSFREFSLFCTSEIGNVISLTKHDLFQRWNIDVFKDVFDKLHIESQNKRTKLIEKAEKTKKLFINNTYKKRINSIQFFPNIKTREKHIITNNNNNFFQNKNKLTPLIKPKSKSMSFHNQTFYKSLFCQLKEKDINYRLHTNNNINTTRTLSNHEETPNIHKKLNIALKKLTSFKEAVIPLSKRRVEAKEFILMDNYERRIDEFKEEQTKRNGELAFCLEHNPECLMDKNSIIAVLYPNKNRELRKTAQVLKLKKINKKCFNI